MSGRRCVDKVKNIKDHKKDTITLFNPIIFIIAQKEVTKDVYSISLYVEREKNKEHKTYLRKEV